MKFGNSNPLKYLKIFLTSASRLPMLPLAFVIDIDMRLVKL